MKLVELKIIIINIHCRLKYTHPNNNLPFFDRLKGVTCHTAYFLPAHMHVLTKNAHLNSKMSLAAPLTKT